MGGLHPRQTCHLWVPRLTCPAGADTVPSWLGGPLPVSGNRPQGWRREEGRGQGEGPASAATSTLDQVLPLRPLPQGFVPDPRPGVTQGQGSLGAFLLPGQGWGLGLRIQ